MRAAFAMSSGMQEKFFDAESMSRLDELVDIDVDTTWQSFATVSRAELAEVGMLITSWGTPAIDEEALALLPGLRAIVHAAGSVKGFLSEAVWRRGVVVTSGADANAQPVAEYSLAMILLAGKQVPLISRRHHGEVLPLDITRQYPAMGNFRTVVGIVGASRVGRRVLELLAAFDYEVLVYDPHLGEEDARALGASKVDLDELMTTARIVSVHAPWLPETENLISADRLAAMPDGATLINTSRAALVDQPALIGEVRSGRLCAVLDVMLDESPAVENELRALPNVTITPHLAGAFGNELLRLGRSAVTQVEAVVEGRRPEHIVDYATLGRLA